MLAGAAEWRCGVVRGADREVYFRAELLGLLEGTPLYPWFNLGTVGILGM